MENIFDWWELFKLYKVNNKTKERKLIDIWFDEYTLKIYLKGKHKTKYYYEAVRWNVCDYEEYKKGGEKGLKEYLLRGEDNENND